MKTETMVVKESFTDRGFQWQKGDIVQVSKNKKAILIGENKKSECFKALTKKNFEKLEDIAEWK